MTSDVTISKHRPLFTQTRQGLEKKITSEEYEQELLFHRLRSNVDLQILHKAEDTLDLEVLQLLSGVVYLRYVGFCLPVIVLVACVALLELERSSALGCRIRSRK